MFRKSIAVMALLASASLLPEMANAASAVTMGPVSLRAGPDEDYPIVRTIRDNRRVEIYGCLSDWSWCDVSYRGDRGWVDGDQLASTYQGRRQPIVDIGPYLGLGVLSFSFGNYWDNYYRGRPFYSERNRWESHYNNNYRSSWGPRHHRDNDQRDYHNERDRQQQQQNREQQQNWQERQNRQQQDQNRQQIEQNQQQQQRQQQQNREQQQNWQQQNRQQQEQNRQQQERQKQDKESNPDDHYKPDRE